MKSLKVLAVIGLAVALAGVLALAQAQQPGVKTVNVTCDATNNKIKVDLNPVKLSIPDKETARWVFSNQPQDSVGACKVLNGQLNAQGSTLQALGLNQIEIAVQRAELINLNPNPVGWPGTQQQPSVITGTPLKAGGTKYSIKFFNATQQGRQLLLEVQTASELEILVSTPTLTEWGLIALAVLLAGGMGFMLYRRRPALRPAAP